MLRDQRISVLMNVKFQKMEGVSRLENIVFTKNTKDSKANEANTDFFLRPDVVIAENGIGDPKYDLSKLLTASPTSETNDPPIPIGFDHNGIPSSNIKFSLNYNNLYSPIYAAGSCT